MRKPALFLTFLFLISIAFAQQAQWQHMVSEGGVKALAEDEATLWIGNDGGLFKIDKQSQQCTWYNSLNSALPFNKVNDILIDNSGSVWIATGFGSNMPGSLAQGGLVRITGNSWHVFDSTNSSLPTDIIYCLAKDANGLLWIGTNNGLVTFDGNNWHIFDKPEVNLPSGIIMDLDFDSNGKLWIADLFDPASFDGTNWEIHSVQFPYGSTLTGVDAAPDGKVWFSTSNNGLIAYCTTHYIVYTLGYEEDFNCVLVDDETGTVWGGNDDGGLLKISGSNKTIYSSDNSPLPGNCITHLSFSPTGDLYIGNENNLALWDMSENWQSVEVADMSLPSNYITAIEHNEETNESWIATDNGLAMFNGIEWKVYNASNSGLPENHITDIEFDTAGNIWLATYSEGIVRFDGIDWTLYNTSNSPLQFNGLTSLEFDKTGVLWIGTNYYGIMRYDGTTSTRYTTSNSNLPYDNIENIRCSPDGIIYVATVGGLSKFTGSNFSVSLAGQHIIDVYWDNEGNTCALSYVRGLQVLKNNTWTLYDMVDYGISEKANYLTCYAKEPGGNVWFGTHSGGIVKYDGIGFYNYTHHEAPLTCDLINAISVDSKNNKWIGTIFGITLHNENGVLLNSQPVTLSGLSESFFIYPNPATDELRLVSPTGDKLNSCRVINLSGETVLNQPINKTSQINITDLKPGVFIIIATGNNGIYTRKFVKL